MLCQVNLPEAHNFYLVFIKMSANKIFKIVYLRVFVLKNIFIHSYLLYLINFLTYKLYKYKTKSQLQFFVLFV